MVAAAVEHVKLPGQKIRADCEVGDWSIFRLEDVPFSENRWPKTWTCPLCVRREELIGPDAPNGMMDSDAYTIYNIVKAW
jgi:hypothetical protein